MKIIDTWFITIVLNIIVIIAEKLAVCVYWSVILLSVMTLILVPIYTFVISVKWVLSHI